MELMAPPSRQEFRETTSAVRVLLIYYLPHRWQKKIETRRSLASAQHPEVKEMRFHP
jgi:hypothetical protein